MINAVQLVRRNVVRRASAAYSSAFVRTRDFGSSVLVKDQSLRRTELVLPQHTEYLRQNQRCCTTAAAENGDEPEKALPATKEEPKRDPRIRDPTKVVSLETSLRYMKSEAYKETYGDTKVWVLYRRNFKGQFASRTRKNCFFMGKLNTGNPCPICRDEYLVLDYRNVDLLKQFISPYNGETLGTEKTGLCQEQHFHLLAAIEKAKDYGTITFDLRFREYDYAEFYSKDLLDRHKGHNH